MKDALGGEKSRTVQKPDLSENAGILKRMD